MPKGKKYNKRELKMKIKIASEKAKKHHAKEMRYREQAKKWNERLKAL